MTAVTLHAETVAPRQGWRALLWIAPLTEPNAALFRIVLLDFTLIFYLTAIWRWVSIVRQA